MEVADFRRLILESAKPFIYLCSKSDNFILEKSIGKNNSKKRYEKQLYGSSK